MGKTLRPRSTVLISGLREGDEESAQVLVDEYMPLMIHIARRALSGGQPDIYEEEDVVQSAFRSFFQACQRGRFSGLANRCEIKRLLYAMTRRKAIDLLRRRGALKYGVARTFNESNLKSDRSCGAVLDSIASLQPAPDAEATMQESFQLLLQHLDDPELIEIALAKLDGVTNAEIANSLECSVRTVERRIHLIRKIWCSHDSDA